jgi:hypothetical protein
MKMMASSEAVAVKLQNTCIHPDGGVSRAEMPCSNFIVKASLV